MRQLTKGPVPKWLAENREVKTRDYVMAPAQSKPSPWRHPDIVSSLRNEAADKCMYCECKVDDGAFSSVEHIRPKNSFEQLVLDWENLGLVCPRCNTYKSSYWTENPDYQLVNPYVDSVDDHLAFMGPVTVARITSSRGKNTVRKLKLGRRPDLLMARLAAIEALDDNLRLWQSESDPELKALHHEDVESAIDPSREYSAVLRAYAMAQGFQ